MKKILYFLNSNVRGGVEEHVLCLLNGLDRTLYHPLVAAPPALIALLQKDLDQADVRFYTVRLQSWGHVSGIKDFCQVLKKEKPDIVHAHLFKATMFAAPLAKMMGVPRVIDTAHIREEWRTGLKANYAIDRFFYRFVDQVIAVSHAIKTYLTETKKIPADRICVVHNGVALDRFTPKHIKRVRLCIGVIGRLVEQKGHTYFLDAVAQLGALADLVDFKIIGEGPLKRALKEQASRLGIENRIEFTGFRSDIQQAFDECDMIVLPSLYEGLPLVALEASAMEKALIVTNVDGSPEAVIHNQTGLVVEPRDAKALKEAMALLIQDTDMRLTFGRAAKAYVLDHFDIKKQVSETHQLYKKAPA